MKIILGLILLVSFSSQAFAGGVSFEVMQNFHDKRAVLLLQNYGLEREAEISVLLSPVDMELASKESNAKVRLPGLLLGGIESLDPQQAASVLGVIQALKEYKRSVTIVKKRSISDSDMKALQAGIREYLALRADEIINVKDSSFSLGGALKNWRGDLGESVYTSFFKSNLWAWVPVSLLILFAFSTFFASAFKSVFKSLGDSIERSAGIDSSGGASSDVNMNGFDEIKPESGFSDVIETEVDQVFAVEPLSILEKVLQLHVTSKFELFNILWSFLPSAEKQISFFEVISSEADLIQSDDFKEVFFEVFKLSPYAISNMKGENFLTGKELARLHKSLVCAQLIDVDPVREKALSAVFPKHGGALEKIIEGSLEQFFSVIYYLFPEKVLETLAANPSISKKVSGKIAFHLASSKADVGPGELEIKSFVDFLDNDSFLQSDGVIALDDKTMRLLYSIPDSAIFVEDQWDERYKDHIMKVVPNVNWLTGSSSPLLKKFFLNITEEEMVYISSEHPNFDSLFESLDERGRLKVQEKISRGSKSELPVNILVLREKIKRVFKPLEEKSEELSGELLNAA
ncbi:MAG: hypothetical protein ACRBBP_06145 [Bdellovibrionales bacterium]